METLNVDDVKLRLKQIIASELDVNINVEDIDDSISLYDNGLGLDSIAIINLIVLIEKNFNISFAESEISSKLFSNVNSLAMFIFHKSQLIDK